MSTILLLVYRVYAINFHVINCWYAASFKRLWCFVEWLESHFLGALMACYCSCCPTVESLSAWASHGVQHSCVVKGSTLCLPHISDLQACRLAACRERFKQCASHLAASLQQGRWWELNSSNLPHPTFLNPPPSSLNHLSNNSVFHPL